MELNNFITRKVDKDRKKNININIKTRFSPEPSGYIHIGHIKNIFINNEISKKYKGEFMLRIDDSNPEKTKEKFENRIIKNVCLIIDTKKEKLTISRSSDNFKNIYILVKKMIVNELCYIDGQKKESFKKNKGNYKRKGIRSMFFEKSTREKMYIIKKMRIGSYKEGELVVRLKMNMNAKNMTLRDPVIYRIKKGKNRSNNNIFPTYDIVNSISDTLEKITHSICTKEFENNRLIYNYYICIYNKLESKSFFPKQIEFSKLEIKGEEIGKRKIREVMKKYKIKKWNDPRLMTFEGMLNRGFDKETIIEFVKRTGFTKSRCLINKSLLDKIFINKNKDLEIIRVEFIIKKNVYNKK